MEEFARGGAICVRQVLGDGWLDLLREGVEANMAAPGPWSCEYTPADAGGRFWDDYCNWDRIEQYRRVLFESPLAEIAGDAMRSQTVRLFHEHVLVKEAGTAEVTPWHHDQPYYCVDGDQCLSTWVPLDPVPVDAAPRFVAGSHHGPMYLPRKFVDHSAYDYGDAFEPVPDVDARFDELEILQWAVEPGDVVVFHMRTLHAAAGSARRRRAFSARWLGDDAVYALRPGPTSPPFPEVARVLQPGDPMDHPSFPLVIGHS